MQGSASKNKNQNDEKINNKESRNKNTKSEKGGNFREAKSQSVNLQNRKPQNEKLQAKKFQGEKPQGRKSQSEKSQGPYQKKVANKNKTRRRRPHNKYRKYRDRRFRKNEALIFDVCFDAEEIVSVKKFTRKTGVSKTTFYRHHKDMHIIQADYEEYILWEFSCALKEFKSCRLQEVFRRTLYFMITYRRLFEVFPKKRGDEALRGMIFKLKPKILAQTPMREIVFRLYADEVVNILREWAKGGCRKNETEKVLYNIMYLTNSASIRLGPLKD